MKIPRETEIRNYELTCLVDPELSKAELEAVNNSIQKIITKSKGKIVETEDWGKKELAYVIRQTGKRYTEAQYLHFVFKATPKQSIQVKEAINIAEPVIRYLLVKQED